MLAAALDPANLPDDPALAWGVLVASVLLGFAPVLAGRMKKQNPTPATTPAVTPASPPVDSSKPVLPASLDVGGQLLQRMVEGLENRAKAAESRADELQDQLDALTARYYEDRGRLQSDLYEARAEVATLRSQVERLIQGRG